MLTRLLGTYEAELHDILYEFKNNKYEEIINVGAAEGYYAIGLSMIFPNTKIRAYEIDPVVFAYTDKMVKHNNKENQIELKNKDALKDFQNINLNQRFLIFVDCERCEFELFDKNISENFFSSDLIIEMHVNNSDTTIIESNFFKTHYIQRVFCKKRKRLFFANKSSFLVFYGFAPLVLRICSAGRVRECFDGHIFTDTFLISYGQ